jgi:hypothetical protein
MSNEQSHLAGLRDEPAHGCVAESRAEVPAQPVREGPSGGNGDAGGEDGPRGRPNLERAALTGPWLCIPTSQGHTSKNVAISETSLFAVACSADGACKECE